MLKQIINYSMIKVGKRVEKDFEKKTLNAKEINEEILLKIIEDGRESLFGEKYDFKEIDSIKEYKTQVPISTYDDYEEYIEKICNGEKNVLSRNPIEFFGRTSGTTGKQKYIPLTSKSRSMMGKYMALLVPRIPYRSLKKNWAYGKGLSIMDMTVASHSKNGIPISSGTAGGMRSMEKFIPYIWTSPVEVMKIEDKEVALYLHLLYALEEKDLAYINSTFISGVLDLFRYLESHLEDLLDDIEYGRVNYKLDLEQSVREKLNSYLKPNKKRSSEIKQAFQAGSKGVIRKIWPKLTYIGSVTGANFSIYDDLVNHYTDNIPVYSAVYGSTEGMVGINMNLNKCSYVVSPDMSFYEFIPIDSIIESQPITKCLDELEVGHDYEIVLTNHSGLYRYRLGDVVKVVGYYNNSPELEFLYRKNQLLNMVSEKTNEEHVVEALKNVATKLNIKIIDYTVKEDNTRSPGRYIFYIEVKEVKNVIDNLNIENLLDKELSKSNLSYGRHRDYKKLDKLKVSLVNDGTFTKVQEYMISKGTSKNQIKIPRVAKDKGILKILDNNVKKKMYI